MDITVEKPGWRSNAVGLWIFTVLVLGISVLFLLLGVQYGIAYNRAEKVAVTVRAEAYEYRKVDDEGDIDYRVYLRFTYGGKNYSVGHKTYDTEADAEKMLGKTVELRVNPEDPREQIDDMKSPVFGFTFMGLFVWIFAMMLVFERKRNLYTETYRFATEYIELDLNRQLLTNSFLWFAFLSASIILLVLWSFFPSALRHLWFGAVIGGIISLVLFLRWMKDVKKVREGQYYRSRQTVYDAKIDSGGESTTYVLYMTNGILQWTKSVSPKRFEAARIGDTSLTVFLNGAKKPFLTTNIID